MNTGQLVPARKGAGHDAGGDHHTVVPEDFTVRQRDLARIDVECGRGPAQQPFGVQPGQDVLTPKSDFR